MKKYIILLLLALSNLLLAEIKDGKVIITDEQRKLFKSKKSIYELPLDMIAIASLGDIASFYERVDKVTKSRDLESLQNLNVLLKEYPSLYTDMGTLTLYAKNKKDTTIVNYFNEFIKTLISLSVSNNEEIAGEAHSSLKIIFPQWSTYSPVKFGLLFSEGDYLGKEWAEMLKK